MPSRIAPRRRPDRRIAAVSVSSTISRDARSPGVPPRWPMRGSAASPAGSIVRGDTFRAMRDVRIALRGEMGHDQLEHAGVGQVDEARALKGRHHVAGWPDATVLALEPEQRLPEGEPFGCRASTTGWKGEHDPSCVSSISTQSRAGSRRSGAGGCPEEPGIVHQERRAGASLGEARGSLSARRSRVAGFEPHDRARTRPPITSLTVFGPSRGPLPTSSSDTKRDMRSAAISASAGPQPRSAIAKRLPE